MNAAEAALPARGVAPAWPLGRLVAVLLVAAYAVHVLLVLASGAGLHVDEAQYWDWSRDLAWGYWSKPPGIAALIAASTALFGDGALGLRLVAMTTWPLAGAVLWWLGRAMGGARVGAWAAVLFVGTPAAGILGLAATTDGPLVLCWALAMACSWQALQHDGARTAWGWWIAAGAAIGLGLLAKYTMGAVALTGLWLAWRYRGRAWPGLLVAAAVAALLLAPNVAWNAANHWPTLSHTADITVNAPQHQGLRGKASILEFAAGQALMLGPVAWVVLVMLRRARRAGERPLAEPGVAPEASSFALAFTLPILAIGLVQAGHAIAQVNWAAPFLVGACLWIALRAGPLLGERGLRAAWAGGVLLAAFAAQLGTLAQYGPPSLAARHANLDLWARMRDWEPSLRSLAPELQAHPTLPLAATQRDLVAHASYAWRDLDRRVAAWPATGTPRNHYEQFRPLVRQGGPWPPEVLVLTSEPPDAAMRAIYPRWRQLRSARSGRVAVQLWLASTR